MKAIMLMFDTLIKDMLPNYGNEWVYAPNFKRLNEKFHTVDNFYCGSLPCVPARRDLHTGKYNFLHRNWGPLEPFDFSVIKELKEQGISTHLITDHWHYGEMGGFGYHNQFSTWELIRGPEGDPLEPIFGNRPSISQHNLNQQGTLVVQHAYNRQKLIGEDTMPITQVFNKALSFLDKYHGYDQWFLQVECFSPHEPFIAMDNYRKLYTDTTDEDILNWPVYQQVSTLISDKQDFVTIQKEYAALLSMCDDYLGKFLDKLEDLQLWDDTLIIVNTDHGFMLGEHNWLGKNVGPQYEEIAHTPFFLHLPKVEPRRIPQLTQTIDIPATLLDFFSLPMTVEMCGKSLIQVIEKKIDIHESILYGIHGGHVNYVRLPYVFMKGSANKENQPLETYTLLPLKGNCGFEKAELEEAELVYDVPFANGFPILKIPKKNHYDSFTQGDLIFDLSKDRQQLHPISNEQLQEKLSQELIMKLKENDAPDSLYERLFGK